MIWAQIIVTLTYHNTKLIHIISIVKGVSNEIEELPKWMHAIPVLIGVALAIIGIQFGPAMGIRGNIGPIVGLPVGVIIGFVILAIYAKSKGDWLQYSPVRARADNDWIRIKKEK